MERAIFRRLIGRAFVAATFATGTASFCAPQSQRINVTLSDFEFSPERIVLNHGQSYVLHLRNTSERRHTFTASDFFRSTPMAQMAGRSLPGGGIVRLAAGQVGDIRLIAPRTGTYALQCDEVDHVAMGMTGVIIVK